MSIESLTKAANIGTVVLAVLSLVSVIVSVIIGWRASRNRSRIVRNTQITPLTAAVLVVGEEPRVIHDFRKESEADSSSGPVSTLSSSLEKRRTPTRSVVAEASHG